MDIFRDILENSIDLISTAYPDGRLMYLNRAGFKMVGWSDSEDLAGRMIQDMHPTWAFEIISRQGIPKTLADGGWRGETALLHKDGHEIPVSQIIIAHRDSDGQLLFLSTIMRDISEQKKNEEFLRESETRYRLLAENASDIIFTMDTELHFTYVSPSVERILGYTPREAMAQSLDQMLLPSSFQLVMRVFSDNHSIPSNHDSSAQSKRILELEQRRKDGTTIWTETTYSILRSNESKPIGYSGITRDITPRKIAQEALNQSKNQLQSLIDVSMDAITISDRLGTFLVSNQALENRWNRSRDQIVGHNAGEFLPQAVFSTRMKRIRKCIESGTSDHFIDQYHNKWFENTMAPLIQADGQIKTVALFSRDVTEQKKTEDELKKSEEYYRTIFEHTATANILIEKDMTIMLANANFADLVGYTKEEMEGRMSWTSMVVPDDLERMIHYHQQRRINPDIVPKAYEFRIIKRDHSVRNIYMSVEMIPGTTISVASLINITERIKAEETLKAREAMLQSIFNAAPIAISVLDAERRIQNMNQYAEQVFGYSRDEMIGKNTSFLYFTHEEYLQVGEGLYGNPENTLISTRESRMRHKNGKEVWVLLSASVLDAKNPSSGWVVAHKDITDRMVLEDQLRQSKKMEAIGQLAGGIAHDFNNILTAILGYTDMVISDLGPDDPNQAVLMEVYKAGQRAASLTKQLLAFSRRQVLQLAPINLNQVIEDLVKMLHRLIGENIELVITPCHDLLPINADRSQIEQVILNLSLNARDAMPNGGQLAIETSNSYFDDHYCSHYDWAKPGHYVMLSMTDSGCGMDQETQSKIFEPFFTTKGSKGTGLGLSTVYGLVHQHNGMIQLYSELGRGTRFRIYLPAIEKIPENPNPDTESPASGGHETILLAEDNEQVRNLTVGILESSGYKVLTAVDGESALQIYHEHQGDIEMLVLDIVMPKRGGRNVYDEIRHGRPDIPCLFMSGYSVDAVHTNFILDQGLHLIQKPFRNDDLLRAVRHVLDNKSS